jgi:hypothetical protein
MKVIAIMPVLALVACVSTGSPVATTGTPIAGLQQTASVGPLLVTPVRITEDSRCPINAICVWAGRLVIEVQVSDRPGNDRQMVSLTLGQPGVELANGTLSLVAASPAKMADVTVQPGDHRFTFALAR